MQRLQRDSLQLISIKANNTLLLHTLPSVDGLACIAANPQHSAAVVTSQTVAVKQDAAKCVPFHDVHSLTAEVADVGRRRFPEDQQLGILRHHTNEPVCLSKMSQTKE